MDRFLESVHEYDALWSIRSIMKEVQDLLKSLLVTLDEAATEIEDMPDFDNKESVLVSVDSAYNDISAALHDLS